MPFADRKKTRSINIRVRRQRSKKSSDQGSEDITLPKSTKRSMAIERPRRRAANKRARRSRARNRN